MKKFLMTTALAVSWAGAAQAEVTVNSTTKVSNNTVNIAGVTAKVKATGGVVSGGAGGIVTQQFGTVNSEINVRNNRVRTGQIRQDITAGPGSFTHAGIGGIVVQQVASYGAKATVDRNDVTSGNLSQTITNTGGVVNHAVGVIVVQQ